MKHILAVLFFILLVTSIFCQTGIRLGSIYDQQEASGDYSVIAGWNVVPYQRFTGEFKVGVVAFHETGVNVYFRVGNGSRILVEAPTYNARTDTWEYCITIDAHKFSDGKVEINARAVPDSGDDRAKTLPTLTLYANQAGTLGSSNEITISPGDDIQAAFRAAGDGGRVLLEAGDYELSTNTIGNMNYQYWTTIEPADGVDRDDVNILTASDESGSASGWFVQNRIKLHNLQLWQDRDSDSTYSIIIRDNTGNHIWVDQCELYDERGNDASAQAVLMQNGSQLYLTNSYIHDVANGGSGIYNREIRYENIGSDIFRAESDLVAVNIDIDTIDPFSGAHPDIVQFYNPNGVVDNIIFYNMSATSTDAQGFFGTDDGATNVAFVNILIEKTSDSDLMSQLWEMSHVLLWHITTIDHKILLDANTLSGFSIRNNSFYSLSAGDTNEISGSIIQNNHFRVKIWDQYEGFLGTNFTFGDPGYRSESSGDYRPGAYSPLSGEGAILECVPADINGDAWSDGSPSLGAFNG